MKHNSYSFLSSGINIEEKFSFKRLDALMEWSFEKNITNDNYIKLNYSCNCSKEIYLYDKDSKTLNCQLFDKYNVFSLYGTVREYIVKDSLVKGLAWLHGSAFIINDKVVLVVGNKNAGKTTWLLKALFILNATFVGNDQIPVYKIGEDFFTRRWRPEIKIKSNFIFDEFLSCTLLFGDCSIYESFDVDSYNILVKDTFRKRYIPFNCIEQSKDYKISTVIYLCDEETEPCEIKSVNYKSKIIEDLQKDVEFLTPKKLIEWNEKIPYWNTRINFIEYDKRTLEMLDNDFKVNFVKRIKILKCNNRMSTEDIIGVLNRI